MKQGGCLVRVSISPRSLLFVYKREAYAATATVLAAH